MSMFPQHPAAAAGPADTTRTAGSAKTRDGVTVGYTLTRPAGAPGAANDIPRIVLIHSLALDAGVWDGIVESLGPRAEVLALDCRGHGRSDRAPGPYTIEMFGDDVADVLDAVGWNDAVVAGCSMGGCVAQSFAARHPQRVRGLVLVDTTAWYGPDGAAAWRKRAETAEAEGLGSMAAFQTTRWFGDRFRDAHPDRVQAAMDVFVANDLSCYAATCAMLGDTDLRSVIGRFDFPVAVVVGEEDYATPVAAAKALQDAIPGASLTVLPGARHLTTIECPEAIAAEIMAVAARADAAGRREA